jgi:sugar/nucleoside kinase (ribokinase family)
MQILNFGSLNIDHVYAVEHFAQAGETLDTDLYRVFAGGKGFNQSIASTLSADTTGAGDTFAGYFLAERPNGVAVEDALRLACRAAAACVQRPGAAASIPWREEIA